MQIIEKPSPNFSDRMTGAKVSQIVLHNTAGAMPGCLSWLCDKRARVSAHYLVSRTGGIYRLVDEKKSAWHAMQANPTSIGIEIEAYAVAKGMEAAQEASLRELIADIRKRYGIPLTRVKNHRQVNPGATQCPVLIWPTDQDFEAWKLTLDQPKGELPS